MRVTVVVGTLTVLSFLAHQIRLAERTLDSEQNVERAFTDLSWTLTLTLADLRAAGQAYVAEGQDRLYCTSKVTEHLATVTDSLDTLRRLAIGPTSIEALDAVSATMAELEAIDRRAREHTSLDQRLLASDLLFSDGQQLATRAASQLDLARAAERTLRNETMRQARTTQTRLLLGGVGISVLAMLLLVPGLQRNGATPFSDEAQEEPSIATSGACITARLGQKSVTISRAARSAASGSSSVTTMACEQSSGTSVNGLPIIIPAESA